MLGGRERESGPKIVVRPNEKLATYEGGERESGPTGGEFPTGPDLKFNYLRESWKRLERKLKGLEMPKMRRNEKSWEGNRVF